MYHDDISAYAQLIVHSLSLRKGQNVLIRSEPVHWPLVNEVARVAYSEGARFVEVEAEHGELYKARIECSDPEFLGFQPRYLHQRYQELMDDRWALISIKNPDDPDLLAGLDPERNLKARKALLDVQYPWRKLLHADRFQWVVVAAPTPRWAARILGASSDQTVSADNEALEKLWQIMRPILRLDRDDPLAAWSENSRRLAERAQALDRLAIRELRFEAPGTDLSIGLSERARWVGGSAVTPDGCRFFPNIPTEEVFTSPDRSKTRGHVQITRSVMVMGELVEGAQFHFEDGKVTEFDARVGRDALAAFLQTDAGAGFAGEIALVDVDSPVFRSETVFFNILYDENAACHFALGSAYPGCIADYSGLSETQRRALGINESTQHTDFMIGSRELTVTARCSDGSTRRILRDGRFDL